MRSQPTWIKKGSNKYILAGVTASAALVLSRPIFPVIVQAVANNYQWTKQDDLTISGDYGQYTHAALSANGSHLVVATHQGGENIGETSPLFISNNYGATWENVADEVDPDVRNEWKSVDISNDGQTMVAASEYGRDISENNGVVGKVVVSHNAGATWEDISPPEGYGDWNNVVVSGDGSKIIATEWDNENIYVSEDGGDTWQAVPVENNEWGYNVWNIKTIALSDNGDKILIGGENSSNGYTDAYVSTDDGASWSNVTPNPDDSPYAIEVAMSADGNKLGLTTRGWTGSDTEAVFYSSNTGANWTNVSPDDSDLNEWTSIAMSDDGSVMTATDNNNKMFLSKNNGYSWTLEDPGQADSDTNNWQSADLNSDGSKAVAASNQAVYLANAGTTPTVTLNDAEGGKTITLTTPDGTTITCHTAAKESSLSKKDAAYAYPVGLVDFCFSGAGETNEVSLVFVTDLKPSDVVVRKYNPTSQQYATLGEATVTETTYNSQHALLVTYNIADNGPLDTDPDTGEVADPVGLGVIDVAAPSTGLAPAHQVSLSGLASALATVTVAAGLLYRPIRQKIINRISTK